MEITLAEEVSGWLGSLTPSHRRPPIRTRNAIAALTLFLAPGGAASAASAPAPAPTHPNILFIASDDLRTELGCYGDPIVHSPNLDRLAARGTLFEHAYCQQAVCCPSRTSLLTGRMPDTVRVWNLETYFRNTVPDVVTLPQGFKQHGYFAEDFGKIYHNDTRPASAGARMYDLPSWSVPPVLADGPHWKDWVLPGHPGETPKVKQGAFESEDVPDEAYWDGRIAADAVGALRQFAKTGQPFFLAVGFWKPHLPFNAPKKYWDLYDENAIPPAANPLPPEGAPPIALHRSEELRNYAGIPKTGDLPPALRRHLRHGYYANIAFMDTQVGKVLGELDRSGLAKNTIVVFWGDNGFHLGEHALWGKTTNYELDTRIPLIVALPRGEGRGQVCRAMVGLIDIYPTLLQLAGLPAMPGLQGKSLAPLLKDAGASWDDAVLSEHPHPFYNHHPTAMGYAIRTARYRYVEWHDLTSHKIIAKELYDYQTDPLERKNHVNDEGTADTVCALAAKLHALNRDAVYLTPIQDKN